MEQLQRPTLLDFHGVSMVEHFISNWDNIQNFKARPDDILIATYPKAGTTWVSYILDLLYFGQTSPERQASIPIYERVPFLELSVSFLPSGTEAADKLPTSPRLIKTHLPVQFVPKSFWEQNSRVVYVARNAKDNAVSYFHFDRMNKGEPEPGDWNTFQQNFMKGKVVFGSWYDHVTGWWEKKQTFSNLHYMFYEDMIELTEQGYLCPRVFSLYAELNCASPGSSFIFTIQRVVDSERELDQLCSFLGLSPSAEQKARVLTGTKFDNMKQNKMANYSTADIMDHKVSPFMRKGKVGDWKNHFTVAQNEKFDEDYKQKMKNPTLQFRTEV